MPCIHTLPGGYRECLRIDLQKDRKAALLVNGAALLLTLLLMPTIVVAQRNEVFSSHIRSLWVVAGDRWQELPVIRLNGDDPITVSFDDMTHEYRR